jgi:diguanylate cyclase (GGDEF)-like protein
MPVLIRPASTPDVRHDAYLAEPNARSRLQRLLRATRQAVRPSANLSMLLFEIDRFHDLFDLCGPAGIDRVLHVMVNDRLVNLHNCAILHLGGGAFICLVPFDDDDHLVTRIDQLRQSLSEPMWVDPHIVHLTISIGVVIAEDGDGADELLHAASLALSHAQRAGENKVRRFKQAMFADLHAQAALETEFRSGLLRGHLVPFYQPIIALTERGLKGFEALARWHHPRLGILSPGAFLPLASDMHLGGDLLLAMLRHLCRDASRWPEHLTISINVSPVQLCDAQLARQILRVVYAAGLDPRRLIIEVTEEAAIDNPKAASDAIQSFRHAGIGIALDDFGSGHASFDRLSKLEIDQLKIDRTLIHAMDSVRGRKLVQAIVNLGRTLSMTVTAEGIETAEQANFAWQAHCDWGQGYYFGKPIASDDALNLATSDRLFT